MPLNVYVIVYNGYFVFNYKNTVYFIGPPPFSHACSFLNSGNVNNTWKHMLHTYPQ